MGFGKTVRGWLGLSRPSPRADVGTRRPRNPSPDRSPPVPMSTGTDDLINVPMSDVLVDTSPLIRAAQHPWSATTEGAAVPENEQRALSSLGTQCALSLAQVAAELAPVPCIGPLVGCLTLIFQAVERARVNKEQWKLLQGRCVMVMRIAGAQVTNYGMEHYPGLQHSAQVLNDTLDRIASRVQYYNDMNEIVALVQFQLMSEEIGTLFGELDSCLALFSYATDVAQEQWVAEFQAVQSQEMMELRRVRDLLSSMNKHLEGAAPTQESLSSATELLRQKLVDQSDILQNQGISSTQSYVDAQHMVRTILAVTKLQLPPKLLLGKQCNLDSAVPVKIGMTCDIYLASFLGGEKVAKKVFRIGMSDQELVKRYTERFMRIADLWKNFRSDYTLPFYGVAMESFENDKHFQLYMVSPLMKNFDAVTYLKQYRTNAGMKQGILRIITDAALGLRYLHNRYPPVVHCGMRGDNVIITDSGGAVLGGFGMAKALESETDNKIPPAVMTGNSESHRWMAPELFVNEAPRLQTPSDVWGWAMAALEIVSGVVPYFAFTQALQVMLQVQRGPPSRRDYIKFDDYAHRPDETWALLERCWAYEPGERPTMEDVVTELKNIAKMPEGVSSQERGQDNRPQAGSNSSETLRSEGMSARQMFDLLIQHGCSDLTRSVDLSLTSEYPIASGGYGDVWKGKLHGNIDIAIKVWRIHRIAEDKDKSLKKAMRELYNWSKTNHENVHRLLGVIIFRGRLGMVSRWMDEGDLRQYTKPNVAVERYQLCVQAAKAVQYLHDNDMVHGDIKACNFLVSSDGVAKITDFDHSIITDCTLMFSETTNKGGGTLRWMAPELVLKSGHRSKQADIYALGMTFLEILTGNLPYYPQCSQDHQIFLALTTKTLPERSVEFGTVRGGRMWALLVQCWDHDPPQRPTAAEVLESLELLIAETAN